MTQNCVGCAYWKRTVERWSDKGETRGTCLWLAALIDTAPAVPMWMRERPVERVTYDDDGQDCAAFHQREG